MGDVYDFSEGARLFVTSDPNERSHPKAEILLDVSDEGRTAVEALRQLAGRQVTEMLGYLNTEWGKVDPRLINMVEDWQAREMAEYARALARTFDFLNEIAPSPDEDEDDDEDHVPSPDPTGSASA